MFGDYEPDELALDEPLVPALTPPDDAAEEVLDDEPTDELDDVLDTLTLLLLPELAVEETDSPAHSTILVAPAAIRLVTPTATVTRPARRLPCLLESMILLSFVGEQPALPGCMNSLPLLCACYDFLDRSFLL
ncbi:hypothetical protein [Subtercola frigoramans]|uniref:hypothetical protein n=1 Tax=Subtercola frigoramans TaxID=120298 RepID=UPI00195FAF43|nr:hypothetical protein [Subtercola frigoramans]